MKILFVTPFYPPDVGGISCHVSNVVEYVAEKHEVSVIAHAIEGKDLPDGKISFSRVPFISPPSYPYQTLRNLRVPVSLSPLMVALREEPDLVHVHGHHYPLTWLAATYAKRKGIPVVLTLHGMYALDPHTFGAKTFKEEIFNRSILAFLLRQTDSVIGLTHVVAEYASRYGKKHTRYYVIPNGVRMSDYDHRLHRKTDYRIKYGLPLERKIVIYRGRFTHIKGFMKALAAAERGLRATKKFYFLFVGAGPLRSAATELADNFKDNVKVIDWTPTEAVPELYVASDIYLLSSMSEGLPITLLEAMAANLHVVTTNLPGVTDVLRGYPLKTIIEDFSPDGIWKAIRSVPEDDQKIELSAHSSRYIRTFDWRNVVNKIELVYQESS